MKNRIESRQIYKTQCITLKHATIHATELYMTHTSINDQHQTKTSLILPLQLRPQIPLPPPEPPPLPPPPSPNLLQCGPILEAEEVGSPLFAAASAANAETAFRISSSFFSASRKASASAGLQCAQTKALRPRPWQVLQIEALLLAV